MIQMALMAAATGLKVLGQLFGSGQALKAARRKAGALEDAAGQALEESGVASQMALDQGDRMAGRLATAAAASGGGTGGSVLGALEDVERASVFDARSAVYRGRTQARAYRLEAKAVLASGKAEATAGLIGAGTSLLSGMAGMAEQARTNSLLRG